MAEDDDDAQKTEDATDRKLSKGREKGQVAQSQEVSHWGILLAGTIGLIALGPWMMRGVEKSTVKFIEQAGSIPADFNHLKLLFERLGWDLLLVLSPIMGLLVVAAILVHVFQTGLLFAPEKIMPDLGKISPLKGLKRMVSVRALVEFVKGILKIVVVGAIAFGLAFPLLWDVSLLPGKDVIVALDRTYAIAMRLAIGTVSALTLIALMDYGYQKFSFLKEMRMTKQEVKDEHRQSEGDPMVKARIRKLRAERARQRMMAAVPKADVVITNPTHYAVALEYKMNQMQAPKLVAKGMDSLALKIREVAEEHEIPIVENAPLARVLYATVELDEEIPTEHYKAVAEVIGYVMRLKGKLN